MVTYKTFNNIVLDQIQQLRLTQPSLDTKPGSVARDLFVDSQALQLASIYDTMRDIASLQSITNLTGIELTNYASNYNVIRGNGSRSSGTVILTFRSVDADITIQAGSVVRTRSGIPFFTISTTTILKSQANSYRANATRYRQQLNTAGITDEFAVEITVEAQSPGLLGNISVYSIVNHSISGVNSVTNLIPFTGGSDLETDSSFRSRILATFMSANIGTALGYKSAIFGLPGIIDALVIEPGDPLMVRDGTVTVVDENGNTIVSEPGFGGRVDIYVMGENLQPGVDSFVYSDKSGKFDPTDELNNFILGQSDLTASANLTLNSRRVATLSEGANIPYQPVFKIVSVSGSISGPNFVEQYLDSVGNLSGNYKLIKDSGYAAGSPFSLDKIAWTSDRISLLEESQVKGQINGIDGLVFTDVLKISDINQDVQVVNENSTLSSTRDYITTKHNPIKTVDRVFNLTTGERYLIVNQNPDGTTNINETGRVKISGRTLPTASDILQVDYTWIFNCDKFVDFDNLNPRDKLNNSQDSIDWGFSNYIRDENSIASLDPFGNLIITAQYAVDRVLSVNKFISENQTVLLLNSKKVIQVSSQVLNIHSIFDLTKNIEVFNTKFYNGNFSNLLITFPTDSLVEVGDNVRIIYNLNDISNVDGYNDATFLNKTVTLYPNNIVASGTPVLVNYVANFLNILPQTSIATLPLSGDGFNSFVGGIGFQPVQQEFSGFVVVSNKRNSPSNLILTTYNIPNPGMLRVSGTTINKIVDICTVVSDNKVDLASLIKKIEGATLSSDIYIARVSSVEAVTLAVSGDIKSIDFEYDLTNYGLKNSKWDKKNSVVISSLSKTEMQLQNTITNTQNPIVTGTHLLVSFYYAKENDHEDIFFSKSGSLITNKRFGYISSINRLFGMQDSGGTIIGKMSIDSFNQPANNSAYVVNYDYKAPKENERITINYEYNKLIVDATQLIEDRRPITADVLVKSATSISLEVSAKIIVSSAFKDSVETVKQDVIDNITSTLTGASLGTTLDSSDIVAKAYNVAGLDRITITRFNKKDVVGTKLSISANKNEYLIAGTVTVEVEAR